MGRAKLQLTEKDLLAAQYCHMLRFGSRFSRSVLVTFLFFFVGFFALVHTQSNYNSLLIEAIWAFIFSLILIFLSVLNQLFLKLPNRAKKLYSERKLLHSEDLIEWSSDGIHSESIYGNTTIPWNVFFGWRENKKMFLLYQSSTVFNIFPKRVFSSTDISEIRDILDSNVSKI